MSLNIKDSHKQHLLNVASKAAEIIQNGYVPFPHPNPASIGAFAVTTAYSLVEQHHPKIVEHLESAGKSLHDKIDHHIIAKAGEIAENSKNWIESVKDKSSSLGSKVVNKIVERSL